MGACLGLPMGPDEDTVDPAIHYQEAKQLERRLKSELGAWAEEVASNQLPLPEPKRVYR